MKRLGITTLVLSIIGIADSIYALWQHYAPEGTAFCNVSAVFSCDVVNKSTFSEIMGVPVAAIGIAGYLLFFVIAILLIKQSMLKWVIPTFLAAALGGLAFSLYLTWIEAYMLGAYCPICLVSQALMIVITVLAIQTFRKQRSEIPRIAEKDESAEIG